MRYTFSMFMFCTAMVLGAELAAQSEISFLTVGNPTPEFDPDEFVVGKPFEIEEGVVYVIEFSGTQCAPCVKAIPLIERLRQEQPEVVFAAVFSEPKATVLEFLSRNGKGMTGTIISDPDESLSRNWSQAAGYLGIPHLVVVDKSKKIAWMGPPDELEVNLRLVIADRHSYSFDVQNVAVRHVDFLIEQAREKRRQREQEATDLNDRVIAQLFTDKRYPDIISICDLAIKEYDDLRIKKAFQARKLLALGFIPGTKEKSYEYAKQLIVDAGLSGELDLGCCHCLMNHYSHALPENKDDRLMHMALAYLSIVERGRLNEMEQISVFSTRARAHFVLAESERACEEQQKAIQIVKTLLSASKKETSDHEYMSQRLIELSSRLSEYQSKPN